MTRDNELVFTGINLTRKERDQLDQLAELRGLRRGRSTLIRIAVNRLLAEERMAIQPQQEIAA